MTAERNNDDPLEQVYRVTAIAPHAQGEMLTLEAEAGSTLRILREAGESRATAGERVRLEGDLALVRTMRPPAHR